MPLYESATSKSLQAPCPRWPSLWETGEMQEELQELAAEAEDATGEHEVDNLVDDARRITAAEYCALLAVQVARNFDGIACARSEKPARELDAHCLIPEAPVAFEGEAADGAVDNQADGAESRASLGLGALGAR